MTSTSATILELSDLIHAGYIVLSAFTLYALHYVHTLPTEIRVFWSKKPTGFSIFFLLNRHAFMLNLIIIIIEEIPSSVTPSQFSCASLNTLNAIMNAVTAFATPTLLLLRIYAIYGMNKIILVSGLAVILPVVSITAWEDTGYKAISLRGSTLQRFDSCTLSHTGPATNSSIDLAMQVLPLALETVLLSLMLYKAGGLVLEMRRLGQNSLMQVLQRDGILCYVAMLVSSIIGLTPDVIFFTTGLPAERGTAPWFFSFVLSPFFVVIQTIAVNMMFLHLRDFDNRPQSSRTANHCHDIGSSLPELNFVQNRFLGNIGAPIETDQLEDDIEEATDDGFGLPHEEEYRRDTTTLVPVVYGDGPGTVSEIIQSVPMDREPLP